MREKKHYFIQDVNEKQCDLEPEAKTKDKEMDEREVVEKRRVGGTKNSKDGTKCSAAKNDKETFC